MATKTINLTGAETAVVGLDGAHAHITNLGADIIYAAKTAGITAGADGVVPIPAGNGNTLRGISGAVYLLGTGSVLVQTDDYIQHPSFRNSTASGGSGVDEVARTAINEHSGNAEIHVTAAEKTAWNGKAELTDIPTTLPANGGNADTVDGKTTSDIINMGYLHANRTAISEGDLDDIITAGIYIVLSTTADLANQPWTNSGYYLDVYRRNSTTVTQIAMNWAGAIKIRAIVSGSFSPWVSVADGGNAASVGAYTEAKIAALEARIAALEGGTA